MRAAAGYDYGRALQMCGWPLREVLITYIEQVREQTHGDYQHRQLLWQVARSGGFKVPTLALPSLLSDEESPK